MPSQKLVRCEIRPREGAGGVSSRYIPLEIFGLWEFLMTAKHGFDVSAPNASVWLDMEDSPETAYQDHPFERVTEVTAFVYSPRDDMYTRACRYFRSDECERLKSIFLSHYQHEGTRLQTHVRERQGIWIFREPAPQAEPSTL